MPKPKVPTVFSDEETRRNTAFAFLRARIPSGSLTQATEKQIQDVARLIGAHPIQLAHWIGSDYGVPEPVEIPPTDQPWGGPGEEDEDDAEEEYYLPEDVADPRRRGNIFRPAHRLGQWATETMIQRGGLLECGHHWHLRAARIGWLWTNVLDGQGSGRLVAGRAELVGRQGNKWQSARNFFLLERWFGCVPDFVITLDAPHAATVSDTSFCSTIYHELLHCSIAKDDEGVPRETPDGDFIFKLRRHDAEEMIDCVDLFGIEGAAAGVAELVAAGSRRPKFTPEQIAEACAPLERDNPPY